MGVIMGISSTIYRGYTIWYRGYTIWYTIWYTPYIMGITSIYIYIYHQYDIGGMVIHPLSLGWVKTQIHKSTWNGLMTVPQYGYTVSNFWGWYICSGRSIHLMFYVFFFQMHKSDKTRVWSNMSLDFTVHHFFWGALILRHSPLPAPFSHPTLHNHLLASVDSYPLSAFLDLSEHAILLSIIIIYGKLM